MTLDQIIQGVNVVPEDTGYWFVRTDGGEHFETYLDQHFIGIGWNEITYRDLQNATEQGKDIKDKIARIEGLDMTIARSKSHVTGVFNKLRRFKNLKKGDIVIIPSRNSSRLAFGIIEDDNIYTQTEDLQECPHQKRRTVNWLEVVNIQKLDPIFYQIIKSRHAICDIKKYQYYINAVTETLYIKDNYTHFVINIDTTEEINVNELIIFIDAINKLSVSINLELQLNEDTESTTIKLNLQSPGRIEFKTVAKSMIVAASLIAQSCGNANSAPAPTSPAMQQLIETNRPDLDTIDRTIPKLNVNIERLKKIKSG